MELQALSNAASYSALQSNSSSTACCNDPACNCLGGKAVAQQQLATQTAQQSTQVHLSERGLAISNVARQTNPVNEIDQSVQPEFLAARPSAGFSRLFDKVIDSSNLDAISNQAQRAIQAYQTQAGLA